MAVRVGFVGVGGAAQIHLRNLETIGAAVAGVCDVNGEAAESAARRYSGCRAFDDHHAMLDALQLDAVYVCLPPGEHVGQEIDAANRGCALFVEKPVGLDEAWVNETVGVVARTGVITSVGYNWRYLDVVDAARRELAGHAVGLAVGYWIGGLPGSPWWRARARSGGQVVEQTTHIFDLCRTLVGEVATVAAGASRGQFADTAGYDVDDASAATLVFRNGSIGAIVSSDLAPRGFHNAGLHLFSRDLVVEISSTKLRVSRPGRVEETAAAGNAYLSEDRAFVSAVATGDRSGIRCDYADGAGTLRLTLAVNRALETGQTVALED